MKSFRLIMKMVLAVSALSLTACKDQTEAARMASCQTYRSEPTKLSFKINDDGSHILSLDLRTGAATVQSASGNNAVVCSYQMISSDLSALNEILRKGVTYCGPDEAATQAVLTIGDVSTGQGLNLANPSDRVVSIEGGYTAFQKDLRSFIVETRQKGSCTGVNDGQVQVPGLNVGGQLNLPNGAGF